MVQSHYWLRCLLWHGWLPLFSGGIWCFSLALVRKMIERGGWDSVRITKVKGHADEDMVQVGRVRELDQVVNNTAVGLLTLGVGGWIWG